MNTPVINVGNQDYYVKDAEARQTLEEVEGRLEEAEGTLEEVEGRLEEAEGTLDYRIPFSYQLFNPSACTDDALMGDNGVIYTNRPGYSVSAKIPVRGNAIIYWNGAGPLSGSKGVCFDENDVALGICQIIETVSGIRKERTLPNTSYIRFSVDTSDKSLRSLYVDVNPIPFKKAYGEIAIPYYVPYGCIGVLDDFYIPYSVQSFNAETCTDGYIVLANGSLSPFNGFSATDYIPVGSEEVIYRNVYSSSTSGSIGHCYDSSQNPLGQCIFVEIDSDGITKELTRPGTAFVRFTIGTSDKTLFSVYPRIKPSGEFIRPYGSKVAPDWLHVDVEQIVNNITKTINNYSDTYNNTYEITTSPTITTDSHGWLVAVDTDTESESGKTDMTGAIMSMLTSTGYCHLGEGIFYVSGNIDMPENSMIEGCGAKTIIRLLASVSSGYAIKLGTKCTIKDIQISGGYSSPTISASDPVGNRHGIYFKGNSNGQEGATTYTTRKCILDNLFISNFAGGGITCHNTGYSHASSIVATNCIIGNCHAGINIDFFSEYHRFTNMMIFDCHYGIVNNGGNNIFTACTIQGIVGFLIDNSEGDKTNNSHGSCVGCSFNHQNNNTGNAIEIYGAANEFLFTGCQIWYGMIYIENSQGILISSCNFSQNETITVVGGGLVSFSDCIFAGGPSITISNNPTVHFNNCYTKNGAIVNSQ